MTVADYHVYRRFAEKHLFQLLLQLDRIYVVQQVFFRPGPCPSGAALGFLKYTQYGSCPARVQGKVSTKYGAETPQDGSPHCYPVFIPGAFS
ncbi:hypothetical protein I7I50_00076 [Histoplasma capsulatum G186AR]|uniref:Uncharacterized protein n=1 Tax=Ajellomyces capsulatus TaxID=5037 RepID=A0A8H7YFU7_AJECA|nr:hypothetical protein I7I52_07345 [Histoplasma capsulatum]QSS72278.1 hypothetical protein I7I50_00076 [Histoplasma capsulatum G186AR]